MDEELRVAFQMYMRFPEVCKEAADSGSKIAAHVLRVSARMADVMAELKQAGTVADFTKQ